MSLTVYADVILGGEVIAAAGLRGKQRRRNTRTMAANGQSRINVDWARTLRQYELGVIPMSIATWQTIEGLHEVTEGGAYGFLMEDPKDNSASYSTGVVSGITSTTFQLKKRYTSIGSTRTKDRTITRPKASPFAVKISGAVESPSNYSLNTTTGVLTIAAAPSAATVTWEGRFYVPVHFANDDIDWDLVAGGPADLRIVSGPSVVLDEVRE